MVARRDARIGIGSREQSSPALVAMERMKKPWVYVLTGGLVAGTFDITYACTFWWLKRGVLPTRVFQSVASGLLGDASFTGGWRTALLGLVLHYFIATSMAVTYYLFARR
jgi:hypothetical protein